MKVRFFNPAKQYQEHKKEFDKAMQDVLGRGDLILRKDLEEFEKKFAKYIGTKYAVGVNSCTDALYICLRGLGVGRGDYVLVPSRTFVATVQVIVQVGATPIFYDLDGFTNGFDGKEYNIKAIIPVHIEGAFDKFFTDILKQAKKNKWHVIEDAAQALGAKKNNKMAGSYGIAGCFSFYPAKILGCFGDGGMITTNNKKLYEYARECRNHFKLTNTDWGVNSRLDNIQAAVLNVKFKYLKDALRRREEIAQMYHKDLNGIPDLVLPRAEKGRVWQDYIVETSKRDELFEYLKKEGIETMKNNYPFPVKKLPLAQNYEDSTLRLPCNETLADNEIKYVINKVKQFYA